LTPLIHSKSSACGRSAVLLCEEEIDAVTLESVCLVFSVVLRVSDDNAFATGKKGVFRPARPAGIPRFFSACMPAAAASWPDAFVPQPLSMVKQSKALSNGLKLFLITHTSFSEWFLQNHWIGNAGR
jgi:hypothetical protein